MAAENLDLIGVWKDRVARQLKFDIDGSTDVQKQTTRILQTPLYVRNIKSSLGRPAILRKVDIRGHSQFVLRPVNFESPMNLNFRSALLQNFAVHAIGNKRHL